MRTTDTIRNDLNLRKPSLRAVPDPDNPDRHCITFTYDANVPCTIAVFFVACETESNLWAAGGKRCVAPRGRSVGQSVSIIPGAARIEIESKVTFNPTVTTSPMGLNQEFCQQPSDGIDTAANGSELRFAAGGRFFPLIIRLEAAAAAVHGAPCCGVRGCCDLCSHCCSCFPTVAFSLFLPMLLPSVPMLIVAPHAAI